MLIRLTMAPLMLCLVATLTTPASARTRHHHHHHHARYHHHRPTQYFPQFRPSMEDGLVMQSASPMPMQPFHAFQPRQARHFVQTRRARDARARMQPAQTAFAGPMAGAAGFGGSSLVSEARRWIGGNPTGRSSLWCATFMNFVLERTGHPGSRSNEARSFASYGHRLPGPQVGAIAVMSRGRRGGHVGVVSGIDPNGNPIIISGNHGHRVGEGVYPRGRIYAYVMP
jgi:uncharacterized protein (TIGR02594 family)